jgi:hypothetical protein
MIWGTQCQDLLLVGKTLKTKLSEKNDGSLFRPLSTVDKTHF